MICITPDSGTRFNDAEREMFIKPDANSVSVLLIGNAYYILQPI